MDRKKIIYVGNFAFPFGNASGKRVYGNGKLFRQAGYETIFVGMDTAIDSSVALKDTKKEYDGFEYYNFSYPKGSKNWVNYQELLNRFIEWMQDKIEDTAVIICYGSPRLSIFISKLSKWAKQNGIKVVSDCVDWLESKTGNLVFDVAKTLDTYYQKAIANTHVDGVICISSYLEKYYKKHGMTTVVIPPLSDYISTEEPRENLSPQIVYAGSPFRKKVEMKDLVALKDRVDKMIDILKILKDDHVDFKFYYYGLEKDNYLTAFPDKRETLDYLGENIEFCGFQDNAVVTEKIKQSDFTFLVRDVKKSTMAGFPTKVSESISYGTPVITTRTSDIELYLQEGENVIFVDQNDLTKSAKIIGEILANKKYSQMKKQCSGNTIFYYKTFEEDIVKFLENL